MSLFPSFRLIIGFVVVVLLGSCSQTNDVVSNSWIQKRKHRQGFHIDLANKSKQQFKQERGDITNEKSLVDSIPVAGSQLGEKLDHGAVNDIHYIANANYEVEAADMGAFSQRRHSGKNANTPLLPTIAEERTEELEELQEARIRNDKNLTITGILSVLSLVAIIASIAASLAATPLALILSVLAALGSSIIRYSLPLFLIYLFERTRLNRGEIFFTPERIEKFTNFASGLKMTQLVSAILAVMLGIGTLALFYILSPWFIVTGIFAILAFGVSSFISWLGIVVAIPVTRKNIKARNALIQLIIVQLLAGLLAGIIAFIFIFQFLTMLFNS